jgi:hypothetical protein
LLSLKLIFWSFSSSSLFSICSFVLTSLSSMFSLMISLWKLSIVSFCCLFSSIRKWLSLNMTPSLENTSFPWLKILLS